MNKEIQKYQGNIYYYDRVDHRIKLANWIDSIDDYNHNCELHHVVPYTDWEKNTKDVRVKVGHNALILLPKQMHQHLENPMYKLSKSDFEKFYSIHPDEILYDVNSRIPREKELFFIDGRAERLKNGGDLNSLNCDNTYKNTATPPLFFSDLTEEDINLLPNKENVLCQR